MDLVLYKYSYKSIHMYKAFKGPSNTTSIEYSEYFTQIFCSNPDSPAAQSFKEWNYSSQSYRLNDMSDAKDGYNRKYRYIK